MTKQEGSRVLTCDEHQGVKGILAQRSHSAKHPVTVVPNKTVSSAFALFAIGRPFLWGAPEGHDPDMNILPCSQDNRGGLRAVNTLFSEFESGETPKTASAPF